MDISKTTILLFAALSTAVAIFIFSSEDSEQLTRDNAAEDKVKASAYINNGRFYIYDKNGFSTKLSSTEATFFPDEDLVEIQSPSIKLANSNGNEFHLTAISGQLSPNTEKIILKGDVSVTQTKPIENTWSLKGQAFTLDNKTRFISSDQAVTITKDQHTLHAIGLNAWIDEKRIELLSKVRGQYVFKP